MVAPIKSLSALRSFCPLDGRWHDHLGRGHHRRHSQEIIPFKDPEISRQVSLADILAHRTGIPSRDLLWDAPSSRIFASAADQRRARRAAWLSPGSWGRDALILTVAEKYRFPLGRCDFSTEAL